MPNRLRGIRSFALYYGSGGEDALCTYDLAVLAPEGQTPAGLRRIRDAGTRVLAYVSVLEVPWSPGAPPPPNVLTEAGRSWANQAFANWVLDPRAPDTRTRLLHLAQRLVEQGYDGLFLDTVADVEDFPASPSLGAELVTAMAWLTASVARVARCILVQNRGLHRLLPLTAPYLDGVCWEAFPFRQIGPEPTVHSGIRTVQQLQRSHGLQVLALNEEELDAADRRLARAAAQRCGFHWYGTPRYVSEPVPLGRVAP